MTEHTDPPSTPTVPPQIPTLPECGEPAGKRPWGFWATIGWAALIGCAYVAVQTLVVLVYVMGSAVMSGGKAYPSMTEIQSSGLILGLSSILCAPVVARLAILFVKIRKGPTVRDYLGLFWPSSREFLRWMLALVGLMVASDCLAVALGRPVVPEVMVEVYRNTSFLPILWVGIVVGAPLAEEILVRGFIFRGLCDSRIGGVATVFVTAALWAVLHLQYDDYGITTILVTGILLGFARLKTGSVLLCMVMHGFMNLVATLEIVIFFPNP